MRSGRSGAPETADALRKLQVFTDAALAQLSLDDLLDELLARVNDALGADASALLLKEAVGEMVVRAAKGIDVPPDTEFAARVVAEARPIAGDSVLGAPLLARGRVIGVMQAASSEPRRFADADVALLEVAANRAALAIDHERVYERLYKLEAVTDAALAHLSLDELLDKLLTRIRDVFAGDTSAVLLLDEATNELVPRAAKGLEAGMKPAVRIPVGKGFAGRIAATREPAVVEDVNHAEILNPVWRERGIKSLLGAPLIAHERLLGVVHVGTLERRQFSEGDIELLEIAAQRAALAIEHALNYGEIVRLERLQREFIALAAHELRSPATSVYGLAATLSGHAGELARETLRELVDNLHQQADRMRRLVTQLLDLSRLEAHAVAIEPEPTPLRAELEEVVRLAADERGGDVVIDVPPKLEVPIDRTVLERVVANLLLNALRYGSPPVTIGAEQQDRHLRITVEDRGPGVAPEFVPVMFERFRRSTESRTRTAGSGLGLAIARSYAREHGGDIVYEPAEPHGARFQLVLPLTTPA